MLFSLTIPQKNIWNLQHFYEGTSIANVCGAFFFNNRCDHILLNAAINKVISLQAGLRIRITEVDGQPMQYEVEYQEEEFACMKFDDHLAFEAFANQFAKKNFEALDVQLYRIVIFDVKEQTGVLLCASHLIVDAWAVSIFANMVYTEYNVFKQNIPTDETSHSYTYFAENEIKYFGSGRYERDKKYWHDKYQIQPSICSIKPHSPAALHPDANRYTFQIPACLSSKIRQFALKTRITEAVLFEAALVIYLYRINTENKQVTIGMLVFNRNDAKEKAMIGNCVTTTPMTYDMAGASTAEELFKIIQEGHMQLFRHQKYPYSEILHDLHERFSFSGNLYDVLFSFQNAQLGVNATTKWFSNGSCEVPLEFHVDNRDNKNSYTINLDYQKEIFPQEEEIVLFSQRIICILEQLVEDRSVALNDVSLLPEAEFKQVIYGFNNTERVYQSSKCVHELFAIRAKEHPDKTALIFENKTFTFHQLDEMSNSLAYYLRCKGVGRGSIVPIASKRSWHFIVAMLGVLKAGAAYMHIDISYPKERVQYMLDTAKSRICLTYGYMPADDIEAIALEEFDFSLHQTSIENRNHPEDLCYVIFTSGSTGQPKGLMIAHRNAVNFASFNDLNVFGKIITDSDQSILAISSTSFDMSVTETLLPLIDGITICLANDDQVLSQSKLAKLIIQHNVQILETTPTKMRLYISDPNNLQYLNRIKAFILGGEALPRDLYDELRRITSAQIFNNYGPAETTVWSSIKEMTDDHITVGKPIANTQIYILDSDNNPLPIGVPGELCISGDGVGLGYLNRPDLTESKFTDNPFLPSHKMYHTGDLASWRIDGEIIHMGRMDSQVKIRGLRIELEEIESVMAGFPGVISTAVTDRADQTGRQYLVAFYTSTVQLDHKKMRQYLSDKLPKYMVPNFFIHLDSIPMTSSGKTDRKALPHPEIKKTVHEYVPPETQEEKILCSVLTQLFANENIGVLDDFFDLGGDSLLAIQYVLRAHNQGMEITVQTVFDHPTVRSLCEFLNGGRREKVHYDAKMFDKYAPLLCSNVMDDSFIPEFASLGNVLLTGATGFLGAHVSGSTDKK